MRGRLRRHVAGAAPRRQSWSRVTGRFVGEDHFGACEQGAHDGDAAAADPPESCSGAVVEAGFQTEVLTR